MPHDLKQIILDLVRQRGPDKSICPSEAARAAAPKDWRPLMPEVRQAAEELAAAGQIKFLQKGVQVDPGSARGAIRLRYCPSTNSDVD